jgi:hypothetical protein
MAGISVSLPAGGLHQLIHSVGEQATAGSKNRTRDSAFSGWLSINHSLTGGSGNGKQTLKNLRLLCLQIGAPVVLPVFFMDRLEAASFQRGERILVRKAGPFSEEAAFAADNQSSALLCVCGQSFPDIRKNGIHFRNNDTGVIL